MKKKEKIKIKKYGFQYNPENFDLTELLYRVAKTEK